MRNKNMEYAETENTRYIILEYIAFILCSVSVLCPGIGMLYLLLSGNNIDEYSIVENGMVVLVSAIGAIAIYMLGIRLRRFSLTEEGVIERKWFIKRLTPWSEYKSWIVVYLNLATMGVDGRPYIIIMKDDYCSVLNWSPLKIQFFTNKATVIGFSKTRYNQVRDYMNQYGVEQLTKHGIGKEYGALR